MLKKLSLSFLAALSLASAARAASPTVDQLQSQVAALQTQVTGLQNTVKNIRLQGGPQGPKEVQFRSVAGNQAAFFEPETAGNTNVIVINGLGQQPSAPTTDSFGDSYTLASSFSDTIPDWPGVSGYVTGPEYTAIYYCPHIKGSGNNTISFPSSQSVKIAVLEFSGTQGIVDGSVSPSGEFIPSTPNDVMIWPNSNYNFASPGGIPANISVSPLLTSGGIGNYFVGTSGTIAFIAFY
jgi:hypothetical protein